MSAKVEKRRDGVLYGVVGSTRSGKTAGEKQRLARAPRALVWDVRGEWLNLPGWTTISSIPQLSRALREAGRKQARIAYWGKVEDFERFCRLAYLWLQLWPAEILIDEVADVTDPGKSRGQFGELIRKGLYYGGNIACLSQRPQGTSTDLWGNAGVLRVYHLKRPEDRAYMASLCAVRLEIIDRIPCPDPHAVPPVMPHFIETTAGQPGHAEGRLTF